MQEINLREVLQHGQEYVADSSEKLDIDVRAFRHEKATDTCFEKADILGPEWTADRIVKVVLLAREKDNFFYGFVFPELGTCENPRYLIKKETLPRLLGITKSEAKKFRNFYPIGKIEFGTSTPFLPEELFDEETQNRNKYVKQLFIHDIPRLNNKLVNISIGGCGDEAHKTSLHLPYSGNYDILYEMFGKRIEKVELF